MARSYQYDVALSFAGPDRPYVDEVANILRSKGVAVFYDTFEEHDLWGKNLYEHLTNVYKDKARFTIMFISAFYAQRAWTSHERRAAQARAFEENIEYILPARFDETDIPGVLSTVGYIGLSNRSPSDFAEIIQRKLISSGLSIPSDQIRRNLFDVKKTNSIDPIILKVTVLNSQSIPIQDAQVVAVADNGTSLRGKTDPSGIANLQIGTRRTYKVLVAHPHFPASVCERVDPGEDIEIRVASGADIGSIVIESTGYIPGLNGRLNPILDNNGKTYLYASNISIDGGIGQPVMFKVGDPIELEDAMGKICVIIIKDIFNNGSLIQYTST